MEITALQEKFNRMGARIKIVEPRRRMFANDQKYSLDVKRDSVGEFFEMEMKAEDRPIIEVSDVQPDKRHLLMLIKTPVTGTARGNRTIIHRMLCGHDERHWFAAPVPGGISTVRQAVEALQPKAVREAHAKHGLSHDDRFKHHTAVMVRQGEWFFVPANINPSKDLILYNEPIRRGRSKPHMVEMLYREGGQQVWVGPGQLMGISDTEYRQRVRKGMNTMGWSRMVRNPQAYAKGKVKHPDHKTIVLDSWHQILQNTENEAPGAKHLAFLD